MTEHALVVFQNVDIFQLIATFQDGLPEDVNARMNERYYTMIQASDRYVVTFPPNFRQLKSFPDKSIEIIHDDVRKRGLHIQHNVRDVRFGLHLAIAEGEFEMVKRIYKYKPDLLTEDALVCAYNFEQVEIALWLCKILKEKEQFTDSLLYEFDCKREFENDHWQKAEWYLYMDALGLPLPFSKKNGVLEKLEVKEYLAPMTSVFNALEQDDLDEFKLALKNRRFKHFERLQMKTIEVGKMEFVNAVVMQAPRGFRIQSQYSEKATWNAKIEVLEWLFQKYRFKGTLKAWENLIENGHVETLRWLYEHHNQVNWNSRKLTKPCKVEKLEIVEFLHEINHPLTQIWPLTVEVARFLMDHGVEITKQHIKWAVGGSTGQFIGAENKMLCYRNNLYDICQLYNERRGEINFSDNDFEIGIYHGEVGFIQFVHEKKINGLKPSHLTEAIVLGHFEVVKYMHEVLGWEIPPNGLDLALRPRRDKKELHHKNLPLVQYLVGTDTRWSFPTKRYPRSFNNCSFETIQSLLAECKFSSTWRILDDCVRFGDVKILE